MSIVAKRKEQFETQKKRATLPHSKTSPGHRLFHDEPDANGDEAAAEDVADGEKF
jgi:hypothetical protein